MLAYFLRKFFHRRREDVLVDLFNHIGGTVPHQFRDVLLRNTDEQALAGVVVSQCVESSLNILHLSPIRVQTYVQLMAKHYSHARTVLQEPRFNYIEAEGKSFIRNTNSQYDLIINDCFNLDNISNKDNISYFTLLSEMCSSNGVCVDIIAQ